jgi:hypothetical protein
MKVMKELHALGERSFQGVANYRIVVRDELGRAVKASQRDHRGAYRVFSETVERRASECGFIPGSSAMAPIRGASDLAFAEEACRNELSSRSRVELRRPWEDMLSAAETSGF